MCPLIDMANHAFDSNAEVRADVDGTVSMIANKKVQGGRARVWRAGGGRTVI
jgi:hypothetical protein